MCLSNNYFSYRNKNVLIVTMNTNVDSSDQEVTTIEDGNTQITTKYELARRYLDKIGEKQLKTTKHN